MNAPYGGAGTTPYESELEQKLAELRQIVQKLEQGQQQMAAHIETLKRELLGDRHE